jgi:hypothetical protein
MTHMWMLAHRLTREGRYHELAERCAVHTYSHANGVPDLAHGLSGRALALLGWYQQSGDPRWLGHARTLARRAERAAEFAEHPYSLLKGGAGIGLLLVELEAPERAATPLFGIN